MGARNLCLGCPILNLIDAFNNYLSNDLNPLSLQWLELHLHQQIPASLLLLSRALYIPEDVPTALKTTLSSLPESIVEETEVLVADTLGEMVDNKVRLEVLRQQEELIKEEAAEMDREVRTKYTVFASS